MSVPPNPPPASPPPVTWADPQREAAFHRWLGGVADEFDLAPATLRTASADASFRRYLRIDGRPGPGAHTGSCIIMDAPPAKEDCRAF
ncbi:MAG: aminoglycoside phosphotransferase, partial [Ramlibacter sp.]